MQKIENKMDTKETSDWQKIKVGKKKKTEKNI